MSLLSDLVILISSLEIPVETGVFTDDAPDEYVVLVPLMDEFDLHADNKPGYDIQSVRISLYTKKNYSKLKKKIIKSLLDEEITITDRQYLGYEYDTQYHHYEIDVENLYDMEDYT